MSKAVALCKCKVCGAEFEKSAIKRNRSEADNWEKWAVTYFDECPVCYKDRARAEEAKKPFSIEMRVSVIHPAIVMVAGGNTLPHKDELKAAGYRWDYEPVTGVLGELSAKVPRHVWSKTIKLKRVLDWKPAYSSLINEARGLGAILKNGISDIDLAGLRDILGRRESQITEMAKELSGLVKPLRPEWFPLGKWNGKIYGNRRHGYYIFTSGERTNITIEQSKELNRYISDRDEYDKRLREIREKYHYYETL